MPIYRNVELPTPDPDQLARGELKELLGLLIKLALIASVLLFGLDRLALYLAPRIPFTWEANLAKSLVFSSPTKVQNTTDSNSVDIEKYLQGHADRVAHAIGLSDDMQITVHYSNDNVVNAFATIGGHVFVYKGILDRMQYEEELDAVLAHEIAHVYKRHVAKQMSRGLMIATVLSSMGISARFVLGDITSLSMLAYSRAAEEEADEIAVSASRNLYGHEYGLVSLFKIFQQELSAQANVPAFLSSHPATESRIESALQGLPAHQDIMMTPLAYPGRQ